MMGIHRRDFLLTTTSGVGVFLAGCTGSEGHSDSDLIGNSIRLTTTTSTYDTGLLDTLNTAFENRFGASVQAIAQGTGAALETGRNGDADVIMVHARSLEDEFLRDGYGINRRDLMFNDFIVVGPDLDPAGIDGLEDVASAFRAIAEHESIFISRGDNSGTHLKEREIWSEAGIEPRGSWYREAGSGMGEVLIQADLSEGYTLADRATFLSQRLDLELDIRVEGPIVDGPALLANPYGIVAVNPGIHEHVQYDIAMAYIGFVTSRHGQRLIEEFTIDGEQVFFPNAIAERPTFQQYVPEGWESEET